MKKREKKNVIKAVLRKVMPRTQTFDRLLSSHVATFERWFQRANTHFFSCFNDEIQNVIRMFSIRKKQHICRY